MKRIVILGGGFGGVRCALDLSRRSGEDLEIILIDQNPGHVFTPALYEVASAYRDSLADASLMLKRSVSIPYSRIFSGTRVKHVQGEVAFLDSAKNTVYLRHGKQIFYDYCVCALGSQTTDYGISGVRQFAYFFKTIEDALRLNAKLIELFQAYLNGSRDKQINIVLAGAGFTGIELAGEIASCLRKLGDAHSIHKKFFSIMIFEAAPQMLPMLKAGERKIVMERLVRIGVAITESSPIESVQADQIKLKDGHVHPSNLVIWTAGIKPHQLFSQASELALTEHGKIKVDRYLRSENNPSVFALGDAIEYINPKTGQAVPALAYNAIGQAKIVANNISRAIKDQPLKVYEPGRNSWAVPIGGKFVLVQISSSFWVSGVVGWLLRLSIDLKYFISILPFGKAVKLFQKELMIFGKNDEPGL